MGYQKRQYYIVFLLLALILIVNVITMPSRPYIADPVYTRKASINLINKGAINIPVPNIGGGNERGQYFYENVEKSKWYSKYGIMNTLMFTPPLLLEKCYTGQLCEKDVFSKQRVFFLNIFNILWTLIFSWFLFKILSFYTNSLLAIVSFIFSALYTTFLWNYMRAQSGEIIQLMFFSIFYYFIIRFKNQGSRESIITKTSALSLFSAILFLLFLCLTKQIYFLLLPLVFLFVPLIKYQSEENILLYFFGQLRKNFKVYLIYLYIPVSILLIIVLAVNNYKFGSPINFGYTQWIREQSLFSGNIFDGLYGFIFEPQRSIFIHFPILLFSVFGIRWFYKNYSFDYLFSISIFVVFFLVNSKFPNWKGDWCYGPRYLLFILPFLSIPFIKLLETLFKKTRKKKNIILAVLVIITLFFSMRLQTYVNAVDFFTYHRVKNVFKFNFNKKILEMRSVSDNMDAYFNNRLFGLIDKDLMKFKNGECDFYPIKIMRKHLSEKDLLRLESAVKQRIYSNYYWFSQ